MSERALEDSSLFQYLDRFSVYYALLNYPKVRIKAPLRNLCNPANPILYLIRMAFLDRFDDVLSQSEWLRLFDINKQDMIGVGDIEEKDSDIEIFEAKELSNLKIALDKLQELLEWSFFDLSEIEVLEEYVSDLNRTSFIRETAKGIEYKRLVTNRLSSSILGAQSDVYKLRKRARTIRGVEKKYTERISWEKIALDFCYCDNKEHKQACEQKFKKSWSEDVKPFLEKHDLFKNLPLDFQRSKKPLPASNS